MDNNLKARITINVSKLAAKHFDRDTIREFCLEYGIHYNLRSTKPNMAKAIVDYWLTHERFDKIEKVIEESRAHWQEKIDSGDKHKPLYYKMMLNLCDQATTLLAQAKE